MLGFASSVPDRPPQKSNRESRYMENLTKLENRLWEAADQLRANSKLTSTEYYMPVLGLIFLRHAYTRFLMVKEDIEKSLPKRGSVTRALTKDDFIRKNSLFLREEAQFDYLLNLSSDKDLGGAINHAMEVIEKDYDGLQGVLPKDYQIFEADLLGRLLKIFNDDALKSAKGDVFGRIYEYFLMKFAMQGAQDAGEFFTPVSLVQTIVNVIEPDHGIVFDPACGSGGMFVQTSHFLEDAGKNTRDAVTFYGQEKTGATIRLAKMNLAVHGLEGKIREGNTFYVDHHELLHKADFVMANPPFNVDSVDAKKIESDPRLSFGLPGVNNKNEVSNGNYLWISYFYNYLSASGRAGFVMSSQASSAGGDEKKVRQKLVETGDVDVMIAIRSGLFYTRTVPCELWHFDKNKPKDRKDKTLMIDARNVARRLEGSRKVWEFSPEQLKNITAIVWLYRGETKRYLKLVAEYFGSLCAESALVDDQLNDFEKLLKLIMNDYKKLQKIPKPTSELLKELMETEIFYGKDREKLRTELNVFLKATTKAIPQVNDAQKKSTKSFEVIAEKLKGLIKQVDLVQKLAFRVMEGLKETVNADEDLKKTLRETSRTIKELDLKRKCAVEQLKLPVYFYRQIHWLESRFPKAELENIEGLVKLVDKKEIEKNDWSLSPGRYVGVAPQEEDADFDFEEALRTIHVEIKTLNDESVEISNKIQRNFEELGI